MRNCVISPRVLALWRSADPPPVLAGDGWRSRRSAISPTSMRTTGSERWTIRRRLGQPWKPAVAYRCLLYAGAGRAGIAARCNPAAAQPLRQRRNRVRRYARRLRRSAAQRPSTWSIRLSRSTMFSGRGHRSDSLTSRRVSASNTRRPASAWSAATASPVGRACICPHTPRTSSAGRSPMGACYCWT